MNPDELLPPLKRCPICRGQAYAYELGVLYHISCRHCGYTESGVSSDGVTMFDVIKHWNDRTIKRDYIEVERYQHANN